METRQRTQRDVPVMTWVTVNGPDGLPRLEIRWSVSRSAEADAA